MPAKDGVMLRKPIPKPSVAGRKFHLELDASKTIPKSDLRVLLEKEERGKVSVYPLKQMPVWTQY